MSLAGMLGLDARVDPVRPCRISPPIRRGAQRSPALLAAHAGVRKVGIAWSGSRANTLNRRRSIPLAALAPLFALPGIAWFSLQRSVDEEEIARCRRPPRSTGSPAREDFDGMAALVAELDLVISVDTSIAHLRRRARAADVAPARRGDRLALAHARRDSPWYPTFRLFRQPRLGDWDAVVREVATALAEPTGS